jgi:hypothetical protein
MQGPRKTTKTLTQLAANNTLVDHDPKSMWKIGVMAYNPGIFL